jgi:hypothetical protein
VPIRLQILINVRLSCYAFSTLFYPSLTQRTKSKFVVVRPRSPAESPRPASSKNIMIKLGGGGDAAGQARRRGKADAAGGAERGAISEGVAKHAITEGTKALTTYIVTRLNVVR